MNDNTNSEMNLPNHREIPQPGQGLDFLSGLVEIISVTHLTGGCGVAGNALSSQAEDRGFEPIIRST